MDKYTYLVRRRSDDSAYIYFCQWKHHNETCSQESRRRKESKRQFNCEGSLSVQKHKENSIVVRFVHRNHYEECIPPKQLTELPINKIRDVKKKGLAPFRTCAALYATGEMFS